jgi:hypothetical protein
MLFEIASSPHPSTSFSQISPMDALDLLVDFAGLVNYSAVKSESFDVRTNRESINSGPRLSTALYEDVQPTSAMQQSQSFVPIRDWTDRPQNLPSTTVSQRAPVDQHSQVYDYTWAKRGAFENCESHWTDGRHFNQYSSGQPGSIRGAHEYLDCQYNPDSKTLYAFEGIASNIKDTWASYQHTRGLHDQEEARPFALPDYKLFASGCRNEWCDCQAYDPRFMKAINGHIPNPMNGGQRGVEAAFRSNQVERTYDPWVASAINEEQLRLSQAQQY